MYNIKKTRLNGCVEITPKIFIDNRGQSIKSYHTDSFHDMGIRDEFKEELVVFSNKGVVRGIHYQCQPHTQSKLLYCMQGEIFDVVIDLRLGSSTYGCIETFILNADKKNMIYVPEGFGHGYQALQDNTLVTYKMSALYNPESEGGILYSSLNILWPLSDDMIVSDKDMCLPEWAVFESPFKSNLEVE